MLELEGSKYKKSFSFHEWLKVLSIYLCLNCCGLSLKLKGFVREEEGGP